MHARPRSPPITLSADEVDALTKTPEKPPRADAARRTAEPAPAPPAATVLSRAPRWLDPALYGAIVALALALRALFLSQARTVPLYDALLMDGESYWSWASTIVAGDWVGDRVFYQAPAYPYFLALVRLVVGDSLGAVRAVQVALGALSCGALFLAGKAFFSRPVGVAAGVLFAAYPPAIFFDALIQKANLGLVWIALLLLALAHARRAPGVARWTLCGALLGLMMLTREETLLLVPALLGWTLVGFRERPLALRARWVAAWALGLALVLAPVALRNRAVGGELVLTTSQAGPNFYIGNGPRANGTYVPLVPGRSNTVHERQTAVDLAQRALGRPLTAREVSDYWFEQAFARIRGDFGGWLALLGRKALLLANAYEMPDYEDQYFYERWSPLLRGLSRVLHHGVLLPLAAAGLALTWRRRREIAVLHVVLATLAAGVVLFYVFARYRYPLAPVLALFAGAALVEAFRAARAGRARELWPAALALVAAAVPANAPLFDRDFQLGEALNNSGTVLAGKGDDARAVEMFRQALALKPSSPELHGNLAISLERLGRTEESLAAYRRAHELRPQDPRNELRLGRALALAGRTREGVERLRAGLARDPGNTEAWGILADAHLRALDPRAAAAALREGLERVPTSALLARKLAWLLATHGDPAVRAGREATRLAQGLVDRLGKDDADALDALAAAQAETGEHALAAATAERARLAAKDDAQRAAIARRIEAYRHGRAWREAP